MKINNTYYNNKKPPKYYIFTDVKSESVVDKAIVGVSRVASHSEHQVRSMYFNNELIYNYVPCEGLKFNPREVSVQIDAGYNVAGFLTVEPEDCTDEVEWYASNENMTVNNGVIEGKYIGKSILTIKCGEHIVEHTINIVANDDLILNISNLSLKEGDIYNINQHMEPEHCGQFKEYTWASDDESVATIDRNGIITAENIGNCNITATCSCRTTATCAIVVSAKEYPCTSISLSKSSYTLDISGTDSVTFTPTVVPSNTTDSITWSSSNTGVATVSPTSGGTKGTIFAKSPGTTTITVTCGSKSTSITITVESSCTGLSLNNTSTTLDLSGTKTVTLTAVKTPNNTTDTVSWNSSNTNIATVSNGVVTAKGNGTCTITATCGSRSATCSVTVKRSCTGVSLNKTSHTMNLYKYQNSTSADNSVTLTATVAPTNTTDSVSWKSSNTNVATVSSSGVVSAKAAGTATITATCGSKTATCAITIIAVQMDVDVATYTGKTGTTVNLSSNLIVNPSSYKSNATWSTTDSSIATINNSGVLTLKSTGMVTVKAVVNGIEVSQLAYVEVINQPGLKLSATNSYMIPGEKHTFYVDITNYSSSANYDFEVNRSKTSIDIAAAVEGGSRLVVTVTMLTAESAAVNITLKTEGFADVTERFEVYVRT